MDGQVEPARRKPDKRGGGKRRSADEDFVRGYPIRARAKARKKVGHKHASDLTQPLGPSCKTGGDHRIS